MDKLDFCLGIDARLVVRILDLIADLAFLLMELLVGVAIYMVCLGVVGSTLPISFVTSTTAWGTLVTTSSFLICRKDLKKKERSKPQCLKITEKVAFNVASEASYVYILSGQN